MTGLAFVDTNVLIYLRDLSDPFKQAVALRWLQYLRESGSGRLSYQVLIEYYNTATRKLVPGRSPARARRDVSNLLTWEPIAPTATILASAWDLQDRFSVSWWDALIVAAAQESGCRYLLTEDLQEGQRFGELTVVNPFRTRPEDLP